MHFRTLFIMVFFGISLLVMGQTWAQSSTFEIAKVTLVSKFARYVGWPPEAIQDTFIIGVYGDTEKYQYFNKFFANKAVNGKDIVVKLVKTARQAKQVNLLYISEKQERMLAMLANKLRGSHVLIISENNKDVPQTMINIIFNKSTHKIIFKINNITIKNAKLIVPALAYFLNGNNNGEILSDSSIIIQEKEAENSQKVLVMQQKLATKKTALNQLNNKLNLSNQSVFKYHLALNQQSKQLQKLKQTNIKQQKIIKNQNKELLNFAKKIKNIKQQLSINNGDFQVVNEGKTQKQENEIKSLTNKLSRQKTIINNNAIKLSEAKQSNRQLSSFQTLFYVLLIITLIITVLGYIVWTRYKKLMQLSNNKQSVEQINKIQSLLATRESQLIQSENITALGYMASDITYAVGYSVDELYSQFKDSGDIKNTERLKPVVTLLENFNLIAADQDDIEIQSFDLIGYIKKMMMLFEFEFDQSEINYTYAGEKKLTIKAVPGYIAIILLNLVNNSLKHGFDNKGKGKIFIKVEKNPKGSAKITYQDNGKGMSKSVLQQVFTPFYTTRSDRSYIGIGMSTTYELIKNKLSGDIKLESQEGKGITAIITFPKVIVNADYNID